MKPFWIFASLFIIGLSYAFVNLSWTKSDISGHFRASDIREVKLGDSLEQVLEILGLPYELRALDGKHMSPCAGQKETVQVSADSLTDIRQIINATFADTNYCCSGNEQDLSYKRSTLVYTKPVENTLFYPMLWVHLDSNFKVYLVFAKRYDNIIGIDETEIYYSADKGTFEHSELFVTCFKK